MRWTSDSKQSLNTLCLSKYLSKSFETLKAETKRDYGYHEMKHNSAIICQNQLELWNQKAKQGFS